MNAGSEPAIVVLPFVNATGVVADEFLCEGVAEAILDRLAGLMGMRVISRMSAQVFKGKVIPLEEISERLGVQYAVEGSVRKAGKALRVSARLLDSRSGFLLWNAVFDGGLEDIFGLQDRVSAEVCTQMESLQKSGGRSAKDEPKNNREQPANLNPTPGSNLVSGTVPGSVPANTIRESKVREPEPEAWQLFLQGQFFFNRYSPADGEKAVSFFEAAIQRDPLLAQAYISLAETLFYLGNWGRRPAILSYTRAKELTLRGLDLEPGRAEGHVILGRIKMYLDLNWAAARDSFQKALQLNANAPGAFEYYSHLLAGIGDFEGALDALDRAILHDPLALRIQAFKGNVFMYMEDYKAAIRQFHSILSLDPNFRLAMELMGLSYCKLGNFDEGIAWLKAYKKQVPDPDRGRTSLAIGMAMAGDLDFARQYLRFLEQLQAKHPDESLDGGFGALYVAMGEPEKALRHFSALMEGRMGLVNILRSPLLTGMRRLSGFQELVSNIQFPDSFRDDSARQVGGATADQRQKITIHTETREVFSLSPADFLYAEAEDNYTRVFWQAHQVMRDKLLRISLKKLAEQLHHPSIVRCHKSFLIRLHPALTVKGNARGYLLYSAYFGFSIPVSRKLSAAILSQLEAVIQANH